MAAAMGRVIMIIGDRFSLQAQAAGWIIESVVDNVVTPRETSTFYWRGAGMVEAPTAAS